MDGWFQAHQAMERISETYIKSTREIFVDFIMGFAQIDNRKGNDIMETMHERIKRMTEEEMREFVYFVYLCGNRDARDYYCDSKRNSYFGGNMLTKSVTEVMPNDSVQDLWDAFKRMYRR